MMLDDVTIEFFHCGQDAYATLPIGTHVETVRIDAKAFRDYLAKRFYAATDKAPNAEAISSARNVFRARAMHEGTEHPVHIRVAEHDGHYYIDRCDTAWTVTKINANGWTTIPNSECPVKFVRKPGMEALPEPKHGGSINDLRQFLNLGDEDQFRLAAVWLLAAMRPSRSYPLLSVTGVQGSAKSTACRILRSFIDPSAAPLSRPPNTERDVFIAGRNSHCIAWNNVSHIPTGLSDCLCAVSDGDGYRTRTLYENDEETIFAGAHPIIVNGICNVVSRSDLADRAVFLNLSTIGDHNYRPDDEFARDFEAVRPRVLGALYDLIARAMGVLPRVELTRPPRMAAFAKWGVAVEQAAGWPEGSFMAAYRSNRTDAHVAAVDSNPLGTAITVFMNARENWEGTATTLLTALAEVDEHGRPKWVDERTQKSKSWPHTAAAMGQAIRRVAPDLRAVGIDVDPDRRIGKARTRQIGLRKRKSDSGLGQRTANA